MHKIFLNDYQAETSGVGTLGLGTSGSYGNEKLCIKPGPDWNGLLITAVFRNGDIATSVLVNDDGVVDVPAEATANAEKSTVTFVGIGDGKRRISADMPYMVHPHSPIDGEDQKPVTPSIWEQYVEKLAEAVKDLIPTAEASGLVLHSGGIGQSNYWAEIQDAGGGIICDDDTGTQYNSELRIRDGHLSLILTERSAEYGV